MDWLLTNQYQRIYVYVFDMKNYVQCHLINIFVIWKYLDV